MGLDLGDKRIGVALSDSEGRLASPFTIIECRGDEVDIMSIADIIREQQVEKVIVGLPVSMNGGLGRQAEKVEEFTRKLREKTKVSVEFRDERLTTVSAKRLMRESGHKKSHQKVRHDAFAAALILQGFLDETLWKEQVPDE
jgi:putative Holliday junction resolvase